MTNAFKCKFIFTITTVIAVIFIWIPAIDGKNILNRKNKNIFKPDMPKHHHNKQSCFTRPGFSYMLCNATSPEYPEKHILKEISKNKHSYKSLFGAVVEPVTVAEISPLAKGSEIPVHNLCETKEVTIFPKIAHDMEGQSRYIVNIKNYEQSVKFQTCLEEKKSCGIINFNHFPNDYHVFCNQLYSAVRLLFVNDKGKLEFGQFPIPSSCVCSYMKTYRLTKY